MTFKCTKCGKLGLHKTPICTACGQKIEKKNFGTKTVTIKLQPTKKEKQNDHWNVKIFILFALIIMALGAITSMYKESKNPKATNAPINSQTSEDTTNNSNNQTE